MNARLNDIYNMLQDKEYKLTPQRKVIIKVFLDNAEHHLSAEDAYAIVKQQHPEIGLATVYRTLDLLADLEVLRKVNFGDGKTRYEISTLEAEHQHHHLICLECGKVMEFEDDLLESLEAAIGKKTGFNIVDHQVKFFGFCEKCK